ncbi:MAG: hypothetical protein LC112_14025 [Flavobacteriales bacterium]|nr:hypothetical protein [Flavobacteriales bacterium]
MIQITPFKVDPKSFHELIVQPQFGDILGEDGNVTQPSDEEGDWMIIDSQRHSLPIIDMFGGQNLIKRRDATCKLIYSPVAKLGTRYISDEKLYAATEDCQEEFYQGCFEDYTQQNFDLFGEKVMPMLEKGIATDLYSNKYFGDLARPSDPNGTWSWNKFNGIFYHYVEYVTQGITAAPIAIPANPTPAQVYAVLNQMVADQDEILDSFDESDKAIYVNKKLYDLLGDYYVLSGLAMISLSELQAGRAKLYVRGIEVRPKKWNGVLKAINAGTQAHAAILTLRGNFLYKTDSTYGGGPKRNEAVRIWWSDDDNVWKRQLHFRSGTNIAAPQHTVLAWTNGIF